MESRLIIIYRELIEKGHSNKEAKEIAKLMVKRNEKLRNRNNIEEIEELDKRINLKICESKKI